MSHLYKSATGRTVCIENYFVTADPGLVFEEAVECLEDAVGDTLEKVESVEEEPIVEELVVEAPEAEPVLA